MKLNGEKTMDENTAITTLEWIFQTIKERNKEASEEYASTPNDEFKSGRALAYFEVMEIIETRIQVAIDISE